MPGAKPTYFVATDVGGTCTDTIVFSAGEPVHLGKALSTPPDFAHGVLDSLRSAATPMDLTLERLLERTALFMHGSTVVDNTILTRSGARTGLVSTLGFEDTILVTRGAYGRWGGLTEDRMKHPVKTDRARGLVEPHSIAGVPERVDYAGKVVQPLDEVAAERAIRYLVEERKVEAIAVSFLWSFYNPVNERKLQALLRRIAPEIFCSLSSEVAPTPGEYERTSTTVINAYTGRASKTYINSLEALLKSSGYQGPLMVMQGYGGLLPADEAAERSIGMLECGPAAGVIGSRALGELLGQPDVIATDMGGTTFKVSVVRDGVIERDYKPVILRHSCRASWSPWCTLTFLQSRRWSVAHADCDKASTFSIV
jgi:N-methylhydantoinase A